MMTLEAIGRKIRLNKHKATAYANCHAWKTASSASTTTRSTATWTPVCNACCRSRSYATISFCRSITTMTRKRVKEWSTILNFVKSSKSSTPLSTPKAVKRKKAGWSTQTSKGRSDETSIQCYSTTATSSWSTYSLSCRKSRRRSKDLASLETILNGHLNRFVQTLRRASHPLLIRSSGAYSRRMSAAQSAGTILLLSTPSWPRASHASRQLRRVWATCCPSAI